MIFVHHRILLSIWEREHYMCMAYYFKLKTGY
jgi:hypothetical protein